MPKTDLDKFEKTLQLRKDMHIQRIKESASRFGVNYDGSHIHFKDLNCTVKYLRDYSQDTNFNKKTNTLYVNVLEEHDYIGLISTVLQLRK